MAPYLLGAQKRYLADLQEPVYECPRGVERQLAFTVGHPFDIAHLFDQARPDGVGGAR